MGRLVGSGRSSISITFSVWKALFLRESLQRLFGARAEWLWLMLEPMIHMLFFVFLYAVVRVRVIGGIDTSIWILLGMVGFFMYRRTGSQGMNSIAPNRPLFAYRQVKPVDAVLVRAGLEGLLMFIVGCVLFVGMGLAGYPVIPGDPGEVLLAFFGLWLLGLGFGLTASVLKELVPELGKIIQLFMTPLYFLSGAMFPIATLSKSYRELMMLNPVAHGLEALRSGFSPYYQAVPELSLPYLFGFALVNLVLGLALHVRFSTKLASL